MKTTFISITFFLLSFSFAGAQSTVAFLFPGMGKEGTEREYIALGEAFMERGIQPVYINLHWKEIDRGQWNHIGSVQIEEYLSEHKDSQIIFFGHSFGAALALIQAEKWVPDRIIACSPSPIFEGDFSRLPAIWAFILKGFIPDDYIPHPYPLELPQHTVFFYGHCESPLISRNNIHFRQELYDRVNTRIIPGATHRLAGRKYLKAVTAYIREMDL